MKNLKLIAAASCTVLVSGAGAFGKEFRIPSDSKAKYSFRVISDDGAGNRVVLSRRTSPHDAEWGGPGYTIIEWDCATSRYRYRADATSEQDALAQYKKGYGKTDKMTPLVRESIKWYQFPIHCGGK